MSHTKGRMKSDAVGRLWVAGQRAIATMAFYDNDEKDRDRIVALWNAAEELGLATQAAFVDHAALTAAGAAIKNLCDPSEDHQRCFHCGAYADECMCGGSAT